MDFETYANEKRPEYEAFAKTVSSILETAIRAEPSLRLEHVQYRAKDPTSLKKKLEQRGRLDTTTLEADIKDLAGCRLVFYTNSDVSRFLNSGIVRDNFEIDWDRTKIHHPQPGSDEATDLFISNNYVVALNESRTTLPEYAQFRDLWCEVQVQTSLNHAWSEMAHDTIYKKPKIEGFGGTLFQSIEKRMQTIMRKFLLPAGYEFQKVLDDFERLSAGKELFDRGALEALADCDDNNSRHDVLQRFAESVLPFYDDVQSMYPDIRTHVIAAVTEARKTPIQSIETPFGALPGHTVEEIVEIAAGILERLRYVDTEATFDAICELFPGARTDDERKRLLKLAERLSKHELDVWKQAGPFVQSVLVKKIQSLNHELLDPLRPVLLAVLAEVLKPEVTGTSGTYQTITFHTGAVQVSEVLTRTRADAIGVLKNLYRSAATDADRRAVIRVFAVATTTPHMANYPNALLATVLENSREIVEFYTDIAGDQSYEVLQALEDNLLFLHRRNLAMPTDTAADPHIKAARDTLTDDILAFRDRVNSDRNFVVYKTLVGFRSVFPPDWESHEIRHGEKQAYRDQRMREFVETITEENAEEWLATLKRCARTESDDGATFLSLDSFLEQLAEAKPHVVLTYLDELDLRLARFLPAMFRGLAKTPFKGHAQKRILQWIEEKIHLQQIASFVSALETFDAALLERTLNSAIESDADVAVLIALRAAVRRHKDHPGGLIESTFMPAFNYLVARQDVRWVNAADHDPNKESLFRDLNSEQADLVLESLVSFPRIEFRAEEILTSVAHRWPKKVVDFFGDRIRFSVKRETNDRYDAVPFELHELHRPLSSIPEYLVDKTREWFDETDSTFMFGGGRLVATIFPDFPQELKDKVMSLVRSGKRTDVHFVVEVMRSYYEGQVFLHEVCMEIVEALAADDPLLDEVGIILDSTGVVTGEFGRVTALAQKKAEIEPWLTDHREKVRVFAERHIHSLDRQIASEQRRSEEWLEKRKRDYGEEPDAEDQSG